jgi:hypothetical protein
MAIRVRTRQFAAGLAAAVTAGMVATGLVLAGGSGVAEPRELTMQFDCTFPLIGVQRVSVTISADIPASIPVNTPSDPFVIHAVANAGVNATAGLVLVGATTVEGFSDAGSRITAPGVDLPLTVPAQIPVQPVPAQGQPLILNATGTAPAVTFPQAGTARISVETLGLRALHPRNAQGGDTGLGVFDAPCTTVPGQNTTLAEITITPAETSTTTTTTTDETTTTTTTTPDETTTTTTTTTTDETTTTTTDETTTTTDETTTTTPDETTTTTDDTTTTTTPDETTTTTTDDTTTTTTSDDTTTTTTTTTTPDETTTTTTGETTTTTDETTTDEPTSATGETTSSSGAGTTTSATAGTDTTTTSPVPVNAANVSTGSGDGDLAETGASVLPPLGIAIGLIGLGIAVLWLQRRRLANSR